MTHFALKLLLAFGFTSVSRCVASQHDKRKEIEAVIRSQGALLGSSARETSSSAAFPQGPRRQGKKPRIVGGTVAGKREFPSFVLGNGLMRYRCAGTLIWPDIILSAAHCEDDFNVNVYVEVGARRELGPLANRGEYLPITSSPRLHPLYDGAFKWDFMLVRVEEPTFDWIVPSPINLDPNVPAANGSELLQSIGFGLKSEGGDDTEVLRKVELPHVPVPTCIERYKGLVDGASMVCAGYLDSDGKGTCHGDSGGPVFDARGVQVGVISWSDGCARKGIPVVNARVSAAADWIRATICELTSLKDEFNCDTVPPYDPPGNCRTGRTPTGVTCTASVDFTDYRGCVNETLSGYACQDWDQQSPHAHGYTPEAYPDAGLADGNVCRNPDGDAGGPWCFIDDPRVRWEYCFVPECNNGIPSCVQDGGKCAYNAKCCGSDSFCGAAFLDVFFDDVFKTCQPGCVEKYYTCESTADCCGGGVRSACDRFDRENYCISCVKKNAICKTKWDCCNPAAECVRPPTSAGGGMMKKPAPGALKKRCTL